MGGPAIYELLQYPCRSNLFQGSCGPGSRHARSQAASAYRPPKDPSSPATGGRPDSQAHHVARAQAFEL